MEDTNKASSKLCVKHSMQEVGEANNSVYQGRSWMPSKDQQWANDFVQRIKILKIRTTFLENALARSRDKTTKS